MTTFAPHKPVAHGMRPATGDKRKSYVGGRRWRDERSCSVHIGIWYGVLVLNCSGQSRAGSVERKVAGARCDGLKSAHPKGEFAY